METLDKITCFANDRQIMDHFQLLVSFGHFAEKFDVPSNKRPHLYFDQKGGQ